jgi:hypothetical protein
LVSESHVSLQALDVLLAVLEEELFGSGVNPIGFPRIVFGICVVRIEVFINVTLSGVPKSLKNFQGTPT